MPEVSVVGVSSSPCSFASWDTPSRCAKFAEASFVIEQRLRVYVECRVSDQTGPMAGGGCSAHVDVLRAPKGKLDALAQLVDVRTPHEDQWLQRVQQTLAQQNERRFGDLISQEQAGSSMLRQQHEQ